MPMQAQLVFFPNTTQLLQLHGLLDNTTGAYQNTATVTATLKDSGGTPVGGLNNLTLTYVAGSNGQYQATVAVPFTPAAGAGYTLFVDATAGASVLHMEIPCAVEVRTDGG